MTNKQERLSQLAAANQSAWVIEARERIKNRKWLQYSAEIAMRVLDAIDEIPNMNQKKLAALIDVTPQYVSKIVKGQENLTLETIAKLERALKISLISFPNMQVQQSVAFKRFNKVSINQARIFAQAPQKALDHWPGDLVIYGETSYQKISLVA